MGECWGDSGVSTPTLLYKTSVIMSFLPEPEKSADQEDGYLRCFAPIIIWSEPQSFDRNLPSAPSTFPQVGVSAGRKWYLILRREIFVDQARLR